MIHIHKTRLRPYDLLVLRLFDYGIILTDNFWLCLMENALLLQNKKNKLTN